MPSMAFVAEPGDVIVDASLSFPDPEKLRRDFNIIKFLNFCSGIEAAVINERLICNRATISNSIWPIIGPLIREGAFGIIDLVTTDVIESVQETHESPRAKELMQRLGAIRKVQSSDLYAFEMLTSSSISLPESLYLEDRFKIPFCINVQTAPAYLALPSAERQRKLFADLDRGLAGSYEKIKNLLDELQTNFDGVDVVKIPPIAVEALGKAGTFDELGEILVDLRRKYRSVREHFKEAARLQSDKSVDLRTKREAGLKIVRDLNKIYARINARGVPVRTELAEGLNSSVDALEGALKAHADPTEATKMLKLGMPVLSLIEHTLWYLRMKPLIQTTDRYMLTPQSELVAASRVLFKHEIDQEDLDFLNHYNDVCTKYLNTTRAPSHPDEG